MPIKIILNEPIDIVIIVPIDILLILPIDIVPTVLIEIVPEVDQKKQPSSTKLHYEVEVTVMLPDVL